MWCFLKEKKPSNTFLYLHLSVFVSYILENQVLLIPEFLWHAPIWSDWSVLWFSWGKETFFKLAYTSVFTL